MEHKFKKKDLDMETLSPTIKIPISSIVPHRGVMSLLNDLIWHDGSKTICEVRIQPNSTFVQETGVPAWIAIEYMAQTVAAHDGLEAKQKGKEQQIGFLISIRKATFSVDFFYLSQILRIAVNHLWGDNNFFTFHGEVRDSRTDLILAEAQLNFYRSES